MQQSPYVHNAPTILAHMERERQEHAARQQQGDVSPQGGNGQEKKKVYVYRTDTGGMLFSPTKVGEQEEAPHLEEDQPPQALVDSEEPTPPLQTQSAQQREPFHFLHVALILFLFLLLDSIGPMLTNLFTPTATITITPNVRNISLHSSAQVGKLLEPLTLSESQTVPATGYGHQDAARARGTVTFYNGLFTQQFIAQGTTFTGSDGVQIVTDQSVSVPANAPPVDGQATIAAHALSAGQNGNIAAGDVDTTINTGLLVRNSQFSGGLDERSYKVITKTDTDRAATNLQAKVTASMAAALEEQLTSTEQFQKEPCTPTITADHAIGQEATVVHVTVSETCSAIAYDTNELTTQATRQLSAQAAKTLGSGYHLYGIVRVAVTRAATSNHTVSLSFLSQATFVYQLTAKEQQQMKILISGKPRLTAIHQLLQFPGTREVQISGIADNQKVPDPQHINLLIVFLVS